MYGTIPVPGPTMMIGVSIDAGILNWESFTKHLLVLPSKEVFMSSKYPDVKPSLNLSPYGSLVSEMAIARS
jgi:hypothetical protein